MIDDLNTVTGDPFAGTVYDVCICGGGVVGITLALSLARSLNVLLLEAGGFEYSQASQSVYGGVNAGDEHFPLDVGRLRFFGGSSNHWEGDCRPLDAHDYQPFSFLPYSGWPIAKRDLDPYSRQAAEILDLPDVDDWTMPEGYIENRVNKIGDFHSIKYQTSTPTRFGRKYRKEVKQRRNLQCFLNANVLDLELAEGTRRIQSVQVSDYNGRTFTVQARTCVLALGGIENPRLLLNCDRQVAAGLGNETDNVGRFFCDHLFTKVADLVLENPTRIFNDRYPFGDDFKGRLKTVICDNDWLRETYGTVRDNDLNCLSEIRRFFSPGAAFIRRNQLLNFCLRMRLEMPGVDSDYDGRLTIASEQALNRDSRITLIDLRDNFGMRRAKLDWRLSDIDLRTIRQGTYKFGELMAEAGIGRIRLVPWLLKEPLDFPGLGGHHHMCSTRMGSSPKDAVVDKNQKVFSVDNLYIGGSSVFATSGHANPTYTIVQMTLRLADHISQTIGE